MRAWLVRDNTGVPVLEEIAEPVRDKGEVLVHIEVGALNRLDLTAASGALGEREFPYVGGVEAAGSVLKADHLAPGTPVLVRGAGVGLSRAGAWSSVASVPAPAVFELPHGMPAGTGATFWQPACTAFIALHDVARLAAGETVIVTGAAGAVGSMVVQQAQAAGANVIAVVSRTAQLARIAGGARVVLSGDEGAVAELAATRPASLLVDTVGGQALIDRTSWVRPGGRAVIIGYLAGMSASLQIPQWLMNDVALLPVNMLRHEGRARELVPDLTRRIVSGELTVAVEEFAGADLAAAVARLHAGQLDGRAVFRI